MKRKHKTYFILLHELRVRSRRETQEGKWQKIDQVRDHAVRSIRLVRMEQKGGRRPRRDARGIRWRRTFVKWHRPGFCPMFSKVFIIEEVAVWTNRLSEIPFIYYNLRKINNELGALKNKGCDEWLRTSALSTLDAFVECENVHVRFVEETFALHWW